MFTITVAEIFRISLSDDLSAARGNRCSLNLWVHLFNASTSGDLGRVSGERTGVDAWFMHKSRREQGL